MPLDWWSSTGAELAPTMALVALLVALAAAAGPVTGYMRAASAQVFEPQGYVDSVLGPIEKPKDEAKPDADAPAADAPKDEDH